MEWQLVVVGLIVAASCLYLVRQTWRSWTGRKSGCTGCSCQNLTPAAGQRDGQGAGPLIPTEQLTLRRRRDGERPR